MKCFNIKKNHINLTTWFFILSKTIKRTAEFCGKVFRKQTPEGNFYHFTSKEKKTAESFWNFKTPLTCKFFSRSAKRQSKAESGIRRRPGIINIGVFTLWQSAFCLAPLLKSRWIQKRAPLIYFPLWAGKRNLIHWHWRKSSAFWEICIVLWVDVVFT